METATNISYIVDVTLQVIGLTASIACIVWCSYKFIKDRNNGKEN